jgi:hypothetical protein
MTRSFAVLSAFVTICPIGLLFAGTSAASPPGGDGQCSVVVDPPKVVSVSGTSMVVASAHTGSCTLHAHPEITLCLSIAGGDSNGQCIWAGDPGSATVYQPYRSGATYIVSGKQCLHTLEGSDSPATPQQLCQDIPSSRVTL